MKREVHYNRAVVEAKVYLAQPDWRLCKTLESCDPGMSLDILEAFYLESNPVMTKAYGAANFDPVACHTPVPDEVCTVCRSDKAIFLLIMFSHYLNLR